MDGSEGARRSRSHDFVSYSMEQNQILYETSYSIVLLYTLAS
jgi:hypothetical protein